MSRAAPAPGPVLVMGAGAIGGWVGGCLAAAGHDVCFVGRPRVLDGWRRHGLRLTDLDGADRRLSPDQLQLLEAPVPAAPALVLLCVKSGATAGAARQLAAVLPAGTPVLSLQNGIGNADQAARAAPALQWLPGLVPYNVAELAPGHWHRGSSGRLAALDHTRLQPWTALFAAAGVPLHLRPDLAALQWGKLLLNLNNPVNALSGLPLRQQLQDRSLRRATAALQAEALALMRAAGIRAGRLTPLPATWLPGLLRLPTPLFRLLAARMLRIDPQARSSMADDLARGRSTEIDALCGEIVRLAQRLGRTAPCNQRIADCVRAWPQTRQRWTGAALLAALGGTCDEAVARP